MAASTKRRDYRTSGHHGVIFEDPWVVEYDTRQPHQDLWVAVGCLPASSVARYSSDLSHLLIGVGRTEAAALGDLRQRAADLPAPQSEDEFTVEWALDEVDDTGANG